MHVYYSLYYSKTCHCKHLSYLVSLMCPVGHREIKKSFN